MEEETWEYYTSYTYNKEEYLNKWKLQLGIIITKRSSPGWVLTLNSGVFSGWFLRWAALTLSVLGPLQVRLTAALLAVPPWHTHTAALLYSKQKKMTGRDISRIAVLPGPPSDGESPPIQTSYPPVIHKVVQTHGRITSLCRSRNVAICSKSTFFYFEISA